MTSRKEMLNENKLWFFEHVARNPGMYMGKNVQAMTVV